MNLLVLVNARHACPEEVPDLVPVGNSPVLLDLQAAQALEDLMGVLDGWQSIVPVSGWRSFQEQEAIYASSLAENGPEFTRNYVALPGHSEHQTGLAIDLGLRGPDLDFIRPNFPYTGICQRFRERAAGSVLWSAIPQEKSSSPASPTGMAAISEMGGSPYTARQGMRTCGLSSRCVPGWPVCGRWLLERRLAMAWISARSGRPGWRCLPSAAPTVFRGTASASTYPKASRERMQSILC